MVLILLVGLAILSGLALILGSAWVMILLRSKNHLRGEVKEAVANGEQITEEEEVVFQTPAYAESAGSKGEWIGLNFVEMKRGLKRGQWRNTAPILLAIFGFLGLLLFGSLALFVAMEDKLVGSVIAAVAIFAVIRVIIRMVQV